MCSSLLGTLCHCSTATVPSPPLSQHWAHGKMESEIMPASYTSPSSCYEVWAELGHVSGHTDMCVSHTSDTHTDRQTIYIAVLMAHTNSGQNPQQGEEGFSFYYISFCCCITFCEGIPCFSQDSSTVTYIPAG